MPDQLSWSHHVVLIQLLDKAELIKKQWYAKMVIEQGWSYRKLKEEISSGLYERQANKLDKTTNFENRLTPPQSDLAREMVKDPYKFHFLTIGKDAHEREIQKGLMDHVKQFLIELGQGFAFVGRQYHLKVAEKDFYIDLLFYHLKLRSFIIIELKDKDFKPEYAGKMNFYLSAVDDLIKHTSDNPSIGLILCKSKDDVLAEYALRDMTKPIGLAEYRLNEALPENIKTALPTIEELEAKLSQINIKNKDKNAE